MRLLPPKKIKGIELQLRDVVQAFEGPFSTAVVTKIDEHSVYLFRPYVQTSDYSGTWGVTPLIGIETYSIGKTTEVTLLERHEVK